MNSGAHFSEDRAYRYSLWRRWDTGKGEVVFIGLNPSTADEKNDDPTIRRCIRYAKDWGYGGLIMLNIFALRSTDPKSLMAVSDPVGPLNDAILKDCANNSELVIAAWGSHGSLKNRGNFVLDLLKGIPVYQIGKTKTISGQPRHPLYLHHLAERVLVNSTD